MRIKDIGGELGLIRMVSRKPASKDAIIGIGDDSAAFKSRKGYYAVTVDAIVEGDHFSFDYFSPKDVGVKAMESNVSDLAAMGAVKPLYAFISITLKKDAPAELVRQIYEGIYGRARKHGMDVLGGDTTHGAATVVSATLIGFAKNKSGLITRSGARAGDLVFVTGALGASTAGLKLFQKKLPGFPYEKGKHLRPAARIDVSAKISKFATAMEDVSDGLASEVRNICLASRKGAVIFPEKIPIKESTFKAAAALGGNARDYALFGGEDFELVFTVDKKDESRARKFGALVGEVNGESGKVFLSENGRRRRLKRFGFDHFP